MEINEQHLYDFLKCPLYFHTKYCLKIPIGEPIHTKMLIQQVVKYFYTNLFNGHLKTYKELETKWDSLVKQHQLENKDIIAGWSKILKLVEWTKQQQLVLGDIHCKYIYNVSSYIVNGQIDFISLKPNHTVELLCLDYGEKHLDHLEEHRKIKYALDYYGFTKVFDDAPSHIKIHNIKYDEDTLLTFNATDLKRLDSVVTNVCKSIEQKLFYPHEDFMCNHCGAKSYCRYFSN